MVYQLAFNAEKHARVCEARTYVTYCIGLWQQAWKVSHTLSRMPVMKVDTAAEAAAEAEAMFDAL